MINPVNWRAFQNVCFEACPTLYFISVSLPNRTTATTAMAPVGDTTGTEEEEEAWLDFFGG